MNANTAPITTGGTALPEGTGLADLGWKLDHASWHKWHLLLVGTAQEPSLPIELKCRFEEAVAIADRPGFTVHMQVCCTFPHQTTTEIGPINMQFVQRGLLSA